ncbi:NADH:ubiquinone oxidoreductase B16.6 subunit [Monoraphidium neglectum]|uniref:NADH dehydrogenase [ubiquinone] 1 alpha subcomplex subunit 13 n=1 Tax=Monoraphidium neglectum TaxID=145388 RepID=A0A0D2LV40_9CHLO|nr:NADH:ubiquinone oxidoreductase B16.6 subunit [Monoraphidium neglectum]KIY95459.1 NADH:ubiquinone oxidoreductase B16.6 subunit [Monoraphidium neglectum]|eukprot:XP_013894479.1 NADH:ubiquinone oxidoreductase B16.6 subunit [Monoraphidium neglectum]
MTEVLKRGFPSAKDLPILQDTPPPGGFPAIRIDRRLPSTGPTGVTIFAVGAAVSAYGYYKIYQMIQARNKPQPSRGALSSCGAAGGGGAGGRPHHWQGRRQPRGSPARGRQLRRRGGGTADASSITGCIRLTAVAIGAAVKQGSCSSGPTAALGAADTVDLELTRAPVVPVLQAEEDIKWVERRKVQLEEEARIMKNVPGWVVGESTSATGRHIPGPKPFGIWDPMLQ